MTYLYSKSESLIFFLLWCSAGRQLISAWRRVVKRAKNNPAASTERCEGDSFVSILCSSLTTHTSLGWSSAQLQRGLFWRGRGRIQMLKGRPRQLLGSFGSQFSMRRPGGAAGHQIVERAKGFIENEPLQIQIASTSLFLTPLLQPVFPLADFNLYKPAQRLRAELACIHTARRQTLVREADLSLFKNPPHSTNFPS